MYVGADFEATVDRVVDDLRSLDCEGVNPSIEGEEGDRTAFIQFEPREGPRVYIRGREGDRFFYVRCYYDLVINLATELSESQIEEIRAKETAREYDDEQIVRHMPSGAVDTGESEDREEDLKPPVDQESVAAALDFVNDVEPDLNDEIVFNLVDIFSRVPARFRVNSADDGGLIGLIVRKRIFPYEESYSIKELNDAIIGVKAPAHMGILFFQKAFGLNVRRDKEGAGSDGPNQPIIPK